MGAVVKVKAYYEDNICYGSGVFLHPNYVLTAEHILCGNRVTVILNGEEKEAVVIKSNKIAALLSIETTIDNGDEQLLFTDEEYLERDIEWRVEGFITDEQLFHKMSGKGVVNSESLDDIYDFNLLSIEKGYADNYRGLSGSPVMCRNRIIGILQVQSYQERGRMGVAMSSTSMFADILPPNFLAPTKYIEDLENITRCFTENAIKKNISSKKYIPDIFVEEGDYKEHLRYFSEPSLFLNKIVDEIANLNIKSINDFLVGKGEQPLDFSDIEKDVSACTISEACDLIEKCINNAIQRINNAKQKPEEQSTSREKWYKNLKICDNSVVYALESIKGEVCYFCYKFILITSGAGQGKTNFLCDFSRNFLLKKNFWVLFYNAYDFREKIMDTVKNELTIDGAYSWEYAKQVLLHEWQRNHRTVTIVVDGLNENTALADFGGYVSDFLKETQKLPFIKVIMSTRNELLEERFGNLIAEDFSGNFHQIDITSRSDTFKERIFRGYLNYFKIEIAEKTLTNRIFDMLTQDTLLLRFFCEVNQGKNQVVMWNIHKYSLFKKYYEIKSEEFAEQNSFSKKGLFDKLVNHLCQLMLKTRQFFKIPRNELSSEELAVLDKLLESDVLFKQEETVKKGLITEAEGVLSFTFDEFRDYCITKIILENCRGEDDLLNLWDKAHSEQWTILEGIERYTFFLAKSEENSILPILKKCKEYDRLYWENVWELEETHITQEDIQRFKNEILSEGKYASSVAAFLLMRQDKNYFLKTNVELLFEILDLLADNPVLFKKIIFDFFRKTKKDKYGLEVLVEGTVLPCDKLISSFYKHKDSAEFIRKKVSYLKLSIYLLTLYPYELTSLWVNAFLAAPKEVEEILEKYLKKENAPKLICCNIQRILESLPIKSENNAILEKLRALLGKRLIKDDYMRVNEELKSIWDVQREEK